LILWQLFELFFHQTRRFCQNIAPLPVIRYDSNSVKGAVLNQPDHLPQFPIYRVRFRFKTRTFGTLPKQCGSIIRGTLGKAMRDKSCIHPHWDCRDCECTGQCDYFAFWSPENRAQTQYFQNYTKYPRTYVVEPPLHYNRLEPGDTFEFNLVLMGDAISALPAWISAARLAGEYGFGRNRIKMSLQEISEANLFRDPGQPAVDIRTSHHFLRPPEPIYLNELLSVFFPDEPISFVKLTFLTPTRLLQRDAPADELRFYLVIQAILRRLSMLTELLDPTVSWYPDFSLYGALSDRILIYQDESRWSERHRYSGSQRQEHSIGGFEGFVVYTGPDLHVFMPLLYLACMVHIGKGAVFGNGRVELEYI
jgi:hypothetical protein